MFDFDVREVGKTFRTGQLNGWDCVIMDDINRQIKIKETALLRYGVDHPAKSEQSIKKHKEYYHKSTSYHYILYHL